MLVNLLLRLLLEEFNCVVQFNLLSRCTFNRYISANHCNMFSLYLVSFPPQGRSPTPLPVAVQQLLRSGQEHQPEEDHGREEMARGAIEDSLSQCGSSLLQSMSNYSMRSPSSSAGVPLQQQVEEMNDDELFSRLRQFGVDIGPVVGQFKEQIELKHLRYCCIVMLLLYMYCRVHSTPVQKEVAEDTERRGRGRGGQRGRRTPRKGGGGGIRPTSHQWN